MAGLGDAPGVEREEGDSVKDNCQVSGWTAPPFAEMGNAGIGRRDN